MMLRGAEISLAALETTDACCDRLPARTLVQARYASGRIGRTGTKEGAEAAALRETQHLIQHAAVTQAAGRNYEWESQK